MVLSTSAATSTKIWGVRNAVYHMCIQFSEITLPNYVHFLRIIDLVLAYDFDDKIALLRQHFFISDKKKNYEFISLFSWKCYLLRTKREGLLRTWRNNLPTLLISQEMLRKCSVVGASTTYLSEICKVHQCSFPFNVSGPLHCSSLQMYYAANLRHACLIWTPFKVFSMIWSNWIKKKSDWKFRNFVTEP